MPQQSCFWSYLCKTVDVKLTAACLSKIFFNKPKIPTFHRNISSNKVECMKLIQDSIWSIFCDMETSWSKTRRQVSGMQFLFLRQATMHLFPRFAILFKFAGGRCPNCQLRNSAKTWNTKNRHAHWWYQSQVFKQSILLIKDTALQCQMCLGGKKLISKRKGKNKDIFN